MVAAAYAVAVDPHASGPGPVRPDNPPAIVDGAGADDSALAVACRSRAAALRDQLGDECRLIIRPPFVVGGDYTAERLEEICDDTLFPVARALAASYFRQSPDQPIVLLLFSSERSYQHYALQFDGAAATAYYGYYLRSDRRIMANCATGGGTLAHELTHALAHFDFPEMPEWFDEGLASLHEQSDFTPDGRELVGLDNWRLRLLQAALKFDRLPGLQATMQAPSLRGEGEGLQYAVVRYFCLFLQERGKLKEFYTRFREEALEDGTGMQTLVSLLGADSMDEIDAEFRDWLSARSLSAATQQ